jgi:hypothetical protein
MYVMRQPERDRLLRLLTRRQHLPPHVAGIASVSPAAMSSLSVAASAAVVSHSFPSPVPNCSATVLPLHASPSEQLPSVAVPARLPSDPPASLPPNSPITPLSYDGDSSAEDAASLPAAPSPTTHLAPTGVSTGVTPPAIEPTCCGSPTVLPTDRRAPDDDDAVLLAGATSAPHKRARSAPAPSAAAADASGSGSGTGNACASDLSWLTQSEREIIEYHTWSADIGICMPAVKVEGADVANDDAAVHDTDVVDDDTAVRNDVPAAAQGRFAPLARIVGPVPCALRQSRPALAIAAIFVLCMCARQSPGRPCLGRPAPGSTTCADCSACSDGRPCANSDRSLFLPAVVSPACYQWPPNATKAVFLDPASGHCSYSIARLDEFPTAVALAWDIHPPEIALADILRAYPHLLPRMVYVQVLPDTLITAELVRVTNMRRSPTSSS